MLSSLTADDQTPIHPLSEHSNPHRVVKGPGAHHDQTPRDFNLQTNVSS